MRGSGFRIQSRREVQASLWVSFCVMEASVHGVPFVYDPTQDARPYKHPRRHFHPEPATQRNNPTPSTPNL